MPRMVVEQLTDDDGIGEIQSEMVDEAISKAQVTIDGYCRGRYPAGMEDEDVPDLIVDICTKLTAYNLYARKLITTLPETINTDYKYSLSTLKQIQSGKISPWEEADEPVIIKSNKEASDTVFNSTVWNTYDTGAV